MVQPKEGHSVSEELIKTALNLLLDDRRIGEWSIAEVEKRLGRSGPQDREFWQTYTTVTSELINAVRELNEKAATG